MITRTYTEISEKDMLKITKEIKGKKFKGLNASVEVTQLKDDPWRGRALHEAYDVVLKYDQPK